MYGLRTLVFEVADLQASKAFYASVLGKQPYFDEPYYVGFDVAGYELGLHPAEAERLAGSPGGTAYFGVDHVDAELERIVGLGARVHEQPHDVGGGIRVAAVVDPFGNVFGLIRSPDFAPPLAAAAANDLSPREIRHERVIAKSRAEAWELWSSSRGVTKWLVSRAKIDLRPGGLYEVYFLLDAPEGARGSETCRVLSFLPERMLSFTWNAPPHLTRTRCEHTWVVVEFADAPGGTRVTVTHTGWPASGLASEPQWEQTFAYFDQAWARVLDALEEHARTGKGPSESTSS